MDEAIKQLRDKRWSTLKHQMNVFSFFRLAEPKSFIKLIKNHKTFELFIS
jgi:hypothetical protein